jgi:hypothetical protein
MMGKFLGVIAAALDWRDGELIQTTEILDFPVETWVYYCRPHLGAPKPGWLDLAAGTLRLSIVTPPIRHDQVPPWRVLVSQDAATGAYEYVAEAIGMEAGTNLLHLALPPQTLPDPMSWDVAPLYGHRDGTRFVLGWSIGWDVVRGDNLWPAFRFEPVAPEAFAGRSDELDRGITRESRARVRQVLNAWLPDGEPDQAELLNRLSEGLSLEEVRTLTFELGIEYDDLAGHTKTGKLRELLLYLGRHHQLSHLVRHLQTPKYGHILRPQTG